MSLFPALPSVATDPTLRALPSAPLESVTAISPVPNLLSSRLAHPSSPAASLFVTCAAGRPVLGALHFRSHTVSARFAFGHLQLQSVGLVLTFASLAWPHAGVLHHRLAQPLHGGRGGVELLNARALVRVAALLHHQPVPGTVYLESLSAGRSW
eukprot:5496842-Pyramimonas_sp.AAC.3